MWLSMVCTFHSLKMLTFWPLWWHIHGIILHKSTGHTKPRFDLFSSHMFKFPSRKRTKQTGLVGGWLKLALCSAVKPYLLCSGTMVYGHFVPWSLRSNHFVLPNSHFVPRNSHFVPKVNWSVRVHLTPKSVRILYVPWTVWFFVQPTAAWEAESISGSGQRYLNNVKEHTTYKSSLRWYRLCMRLELVL